MLLDIYAVVMMLGWAGVAFYLVIGSRRIDYLKHVNPGGASKASVAIIVAVRNEEDELETALTSLSQLSYPNYNIYVVNDRSTDKTPEIIRKVAVRNNHITVVTVEELPTGWLGKNHALYLGYKQTREEWLLFTDADVVFEDNTLAKALSYAETHNLDHLTILPELRSPSKLFMSVVNTFALMLYIKLRPWNANNPRSDASIGIGAFNLMRRSAYEQIGTHAAFSMRPDDDLKLGEKVKAMGLKQHVSYGTKQVWLQWYTSVGEFIKGLMKNTFSVSNYNIWLASFNTIAVVVLIVLPVPLLLLSGHPYHYAGLFIMMLHVSIFTFTRGINSRWWHALMVTFAGMIMVFILVASTYLTLKRGGIYWRGTFYPLKELRKQS